MKKFLLFVACSCLLAAVSIASPVTFDNGHYQNFQVCESAGLYYINGFLLASDADAGDTETWSVASAALHGTLVATYSTTSTGGTLSPVAISYTPTPGYVGMDTFSIRISDGTSADTTTMYIEVRATSNAGTIIGPTTMCGGTSATFSSTVGVAGGMWFSTNTNAVAATDTSSISHSFTAVHPGIDSVVFVVANGCGIDAAFHVITIIGSAVGPITGPSAICIGSTATLSAPLLGGTWVATNGNATVADSVVTGVSAGIDTIMHIATSTCGTDTARFVITVDTGIVSAGAITGLDHVCQGASVTLADAVAGGMWSHTNTANVISTAGVLSASATATGVDTVAYTLTNGCGSSVAHHVVHIMTLPIATITGYDSVCSGSSITLVGADAGGTWISSIPDFAFVSGTGVVTGSLNGSTTISYSVTNSCGTSTATHDVRVNVPAGPISGELTLCQANLGTYTNSVGGGTWSSSSIFNAAPVPFIPGGFFGGVTGPVDIIYTVNNACGTTVATLSIEVIVCNTGVNELAANTGVISLMPNPSQGAMTITVPTAATENATVVVTNMLGAKVKEFTVNTNTPTDVNLDIPAGVYVLSAATKTAQFTARMVVTK